MILTSSPGTPIPGMPIRYEATPMLATSRPTADARSRLPRYPLRFEPIYQHRPWGGRRLADLLAAPLPDGLVGEAWLLSDRDDHQSRVANGPLEGQSIGQLLEQWPEEMLGSLAGCFPRFPLLLKFIDARGMLSVQVHPSDHQAADLLLGDSGKTEAWVVLEAEPDSHIYAGLKPGTTADDLRRSLADTTVTDRLACFTPKAGDGVFLPAGTVHALGGGVVVFEVQQNSDLTFRLYDWDRADPRTGRLRELQVDRALACADFAAGPVAPVLPVEQHGDPLPAEEVFRCEQFGLRRFTGETRFGVGIQGSPRVLVCIGGEGDLEYDDQTFAVRTGEVVLLPAAVGACVFQPAGVVSLLEVSLPKGAHR
ncbi:MAG TPA: type I phosphomannose isomerase catalytic subunit [Sporichthyaceae bacterium]|nr:type I phosphomannose isomerase catalytic subunit [Sporichthyaceae bacterium]